MRKVGLSEAKQKLSELVEKAAQGERIGITKRGKLAAVMGPAEQGGADLRQIFAEMDKIRKRSRKPKNVSVKELIEEGRI
jgi:prevent-host-death family protein